MVLPVGSSGLIGALLVAGYPENLAIETGITCLDRQILVFYCLQKFIFK
jgi:hypothetical protein